MIEKSSSGKISPLHSFSYLSTQLWEKPAGQISSFQSFRHFLCPENLAASNDHLSRPLQDPCSTWSLKKRRRGKKKKGGKTMIFFLFLHLPALRWICETQKNVSPPLACSNSPPCKFADWVENSNRNIWGLFFFQPFSLPRPKQIKIYIFYQHSFYTETRAKMHPLMHWLKPTVHNALVAFTSP